MDYKITENNEYFDIIEPLVKASGLKLVEFTLSKVKDVLHIYLIIYSENGLSISDCSRVHKLTQARLEAFTGNRNFHIEVSSPGITRNIKYANEFSVFKGRKARILLNNENEWIKAEIKDATETEAVLGISEEIRTINYLDIRKAKLDF